MSRTYIIRAEETRQLPDTFNGVEWVPGLVVPDIKLPANSWTAVACHGGFQLTIEWQGRAVYSAWHGPHTIAGQTIFFVGIDDDADKTILAGLREGLGAENCAPLIRVLRLQTARGQAVRNYVKAQPWFNPIRNSLGTIIGIHAPLVIAGRSTVDLDGDDEETATEVIGLEG